MPPCGLRRNAFQFLKIVSRRASKRLLANVLLFCFLCACIRVVLSFAVETKQTSPGLQKPSIAICCARTIRFVFETTIRKNATISILCSRHFKKQKFVFLPSFSPRLSFPSFERLSELGPFPHTNTHSVDAVYRDLTPTHTCMHSFARSQSARISSADK